MCLLQACLLHGQLEKREVTVTGQKFPLTEIRRKLLAKHETYMRLRSDEEVEAMTISSLHTCKYIILLIVVRLQMSFIIM